MAIQLVINKEFGLSKNENPTQGAFIMPDGMRLSNTAAGLSTEPDGMFVTFDAFRSGRARRQTGSRT